jgi:hypothetical protein
MDKFDDDCLPKQPLVVEVGAVRREIPKLESTSSQDSEGDTEIIGTVLAILSAILSFGSPSRPVEEEKLLRGLLTSLQSLASFESDPELSQSASDVALVLLTRSSSGVVKDPSVARQSKVLSRGNSAFEKVVNDSTDLLNSESPAMRGLGIRNIIIALREPVEPLSDDDRAIGVRVLTSLLADPESFVYLNVIHAVSRLAFSDKGQVFTILLEMYAPPILSASALTVRQRVILSEALALILRRSGDVAPVYAPACIRVCIQCIKSDEIDAYSATEKEEFNLLRQSAISLLAEAFLVSNWSAIKYLNDVLDISLGIIQLENPAISSKKYAEHLLSGLKYSVHTSRRAAAFLIRYILTGLHQKLFRTTDGRSYETIISALERVEAYPSRNVIVEGKLINVPEDSVVLFHVRCALALIEDLQAQEFSMISAQS